MKVPLIVTGSKGLVASSFVEDFAEKYSIEPVNLSDPLNPIDITDRNKVAQALGSSSAETIIHFAAYTDLNSAWEDRGNKDGIAYNVNVNGTKNIAEEARKNNQHLIHISTAYVFDGEKEDLYNEADSPNPIEWYGQTKLEAENVINSIDGLRATILRIDQPFKPKPFKKIDTAHRVMGGLKSGTLYPQFTNHYFGPTFLPDFALILDAVIERKPLGIYHASSGESWNDFQFATEIQKALGLPGKIEAGDLYKYLETAKRPYQKNTALNSSKLQKLLALKITNISGAIKSLVFE